MHKKRISMLLQKKYVQIERVRKRVEYRKKKSHLKLQSYMHIHHVLYYIYLHVNDRNEKDVPLFLILGSPRVAAETEKN